LQLSTQPARRTCARLRVTVRRHLDGTHSVWCGPQCLGRYDATAAPLVASTPRRPPRARAHRLPALRRRPTPSLALPSPRRTRPRRGPRLPTSPQARPDRSLVQTKRTFHVSTTGAPWAGRGSPSWRLICPASESSRGAARAPRVERVHGEAAM
jgi:hypothetical protein